MICIDTIVIPEGKLVKFINIDREIINDNIILLIISLIISINVNVTGYKYKNFEIIYSNVNEYNFENKKFRKNDTFLHLVFYNGLWKQEFKSFEEKILTLCYTKIN